MAIDDKVKDLDESEGKASNEEIKSLHESLSSDDKITSLMLDKCYDTIVCLTKGGLFNSYLQS